MLSEKLEKMIFDAKAENRALARKYTKELNAKFAKLITPKSLAQVLDNLLYEEVTPAELVAYANGDLTNEGKVMAFYQRLFDK